MHLSLTLYTQLIVVGLLATYEWNRNKFGGIFRDNSCVFKRVKNRYFCMKSEPDFLTYLIDDLHEFFVIFFFCTNYELESFRIE